MNSVKKQNLGNNTCPVSFAKICMWSTKLTLVLLVQFILNIILSWEIISFAFFQFMGVSLGKAQDKMMWSVGNLARAESLSALAFLSHISAGLCVVVLVHACNIT